MFARLRIVATVLAALAYAGAAEAQVPVITSQSQHAGNPGSSVVLTGFNFATTLDVRFGGTSAPFAVDNPNQITATVPAGAPAGAITVINPSGTGTAPVPFYPGPVPTLVIGPVYPPPLGHNFTATGAPNDGEISRAGGKTFFISNVPLANTRLVSFGPQPDGIRLAFRDAAFDPPLPQHILTFQPSLSNLPAGIAVWAGQTSFDDGQPVLTRFTMTATDTASGQPVPLVAATDLGLPGTIGALHGILPGQAFSVKHRFDASMGPPYPVQYLPALDVFDGYQCSVFPTCGKTSARSSYSFGYYYDNLPPRLTVNTGLALPQGATAPIDITRLKAVDIDGSDSEITFTASLVPSHGTLFKAGVPVSSGGTFTQQDINDGLMSYTHDDSCDASDLFLFEAVDAHGAVMSDGPFTTFNFNIFAVLDNVPPVPVDAGFSVAHGGSVTSTLTATNSDCVAPTYTFAIVSPPTKGTISGFNDATGAFTYTATLGQTGPDSFTFSVNDGVHGSVAPGTISISIENQPPVVTQQTLTTPEEIAASGTAVATDSDLPAQTLTFSIGTNGAKGTAVINPTTGAFTYTPASGRFGRDTFTVVANDGEVDSPPATFTMDIRPKLLVGRVLVNSEDTGSPSDRFVLLVNPANSDLGLVAQSNNFSQLRGVTHGPSGVVVVSSGPPATLYRVDNGVVALGPITSSPPIGPVGIATEANGNFLVAQATAGVGRYSSSGPALTGYTGGNLQLVSDVSVAANGDIFVSDAGSLAGGSNKIVKIDPVSGNQTVIASGGVLDGSGILFGLTVDTNGDIYTTHGAPMLTGGTVFKVTPGGTVTPVTSGGLLDGAAGITFGAPGELIVASSSNDSIVKVNIATGIQTMVHSGSPLVSPFGIRRIASLEGVGLNYFTINPCRVVDTRGGAPIGGPVLQAQQTRTLAVAGNCAIPASAKAISINLAVTQPTATGNVRLFPAGQPVPTISSINYSTGQTRGNNSVVPLSALGQMAAFVGQPAGTTVHLIIDVNGYFE